ncbi:GAF domain-containing protein [Bacillus piscicola]|uniref:GAF domain-containing protein n=1 Tax=Bacillus piscicola TaxID=1632684 RepID=UPI001F0907F6|nr:GAF domain-containing protein [Bacillus piscicola]
MSIATDIASIRVLSSIYRNQALAESCTETVRTLCEKVEYIDWAGIYFYDGEEKVLSAHASSLPDKKETMQSQLAFPIKNKDREFGTLVVKSRQWIVFDVTDVSTLEKVAAALGAAAS